MPDRIGPMNLEEMLEQARESYARPGEPGEEAVPELFPGPPTGTCSSEAFVDRLLDAAFQRSAKLRHPFAIRLARGEWKKHQIQEWVRQEYQGIVYLIRRHTLLAANCSNDETIWGLLTRVKVEADSDPVGGNFFALPKLWTKFGIALGLSREELTGFRPHPLLGLFNESSLAEVRFSATLPLRDFVDAMLDPLFHQLWGESLENSLHPPHDALDFFWAIASDRWGGETGRSILQGWAGTPEAQAELWSRYQSEVEQDREWLRFTILQRILESRRVETVA